MSGAVGAAALPSDDDVTHDDAVAPQVVVLSTDSDDDAPIVGPGKASKTNKRGRGFPLRATTPFPPFPAVEYSSVDALKQALKERNPACVPRLRSSTSTHIRIGCRHTGKLPKGVFQGQASLPCPLNVSGSRDRDGSVIRISRSTYVAGDCSERICACCHEVLVTTGQVNCPNNHRFCLTCFDHIVLTQVREDKVFFIKTCEVSCRFCSPASFFNMHTLINCVEKETWKKYIAAVTEGAVVEEQQRMQAQGPRAVDPNEDIAFVAGLICRSCPKCKVILADEFSGCLALKCGRVHGFGGGGCGGEFCGYCSELCQSERDVHEHLDTCPWNPRPGSVFPGNDYETIVWNVRRNRVWYHVMSNAAHKIPAIWDKISSNYQELGLTREWLEQRAKWVEVASSEFEICLADFFSLVPKLMRCISTLQDMGFPDDDDNLFRASIICKADPHQACLTLLANAHD